LEVGAKSREIPLDTPGAADHHVVGAGNAISRDDLASERSKAPLHPVAHDGSADFFGDCETDAHRGVAILALADQQNESGRGRPLAAVGRDEVRALAERD
jgi:hypothetical protein